MNGSEVYPVNLCAPLWLKVFPWARTKLPEPASRLIQSLGPFAERKPHLPCPIPRISIKTRSRYRGDADLFHQIFSERNVILGAKCRDVRHHVIRPARTKAA